jgi:hypothetical protein
VEAPAQHLPRQPRAVHALHVAAQVEFESKIGSKIGSKIVSGSPYFSFKALSYRRFQHGWIGSICTGTP